MSPTMPTAGSSRKPRRSSRVPRSPGVVEGPVHHSIGTLRSAQARMRSSMPASTTSGSNRARTTLLNNGNGKCESVQQHAPSSCSWRRGQVFRCSKSEKRLASTADAVEAGEKSARMLAILFEAGALGACAVCG
jgi:hypothetical protein